MVKPCETYTLCCLPWCRCNVNSWWNQENVIVMVKPWWNLHSSQQSSILVTPRRGTKRRRCLPGPKSHQKQRRSVEGSGGWPVEWTTDAISCVKEFSTRKKAYVQFTTSRWVEKNRVEKGLCSSSRFERGCLVHCASILAEHSEFLSFLVGARSSVCPRKIKYVITCTMTSSEKNLFGRGVATEKGHAFPNGPAQRGSTRFQGLNTDQAEIATIF